MNVIDYGHGAQNLPDKCPGDDSHPDPSANNMPLQFSGHIGPTVLEQIHEGAGERRKLLFPGSANISPTQQEMWGVVHGFQGNIADSTAGMMMQDGPAMLMGASRVMAGLGPMGEIGPRFEMGPAYGGIPRQESGLTCDRSMQGIPNKLQLGLVEKDGIPQASRKPVLHFNGFTLFPPSVYQGPPPVGEKPLGCKTIFIGGQPEKMTMEMMQELFSKHGGKIINIRQGKRNFCHIRFAEESAVDKAMFVSGYRVRIGANIEPESNGRFRVDFAQNRDDQYEFECEQRRRAREVRHAGNDTSIDERRPKESTLIPRYSPPEGSTLLHKLKDGDSFPLATNHLIAWLERGECDKRNSSQFYSMVQATHSHVRRLIGEKAHCDIQLNQMQQNYRVQVIGLITQYTRIEQVLTSACKQRAWDHFTKAQRKNIEVWKQQTKELRQQQQDELGLGTKGEAEMELSDEEEDLKANVKCLKTEQEQVSRPSPPENQLQLQVQALMNQNNILRNQLETYKHREESGNLAPLGTTLPATPHEEMETQIKALQHSLLAMQQQLQETKNRLKKEESSRKEAEEKLKTLEFKHMQLMASEESVKGCDTLPAFDKSTCEERATLDLKRATMIGLLSIFLNVHPFGASTEYLWSYMQRINPSITMMEIETLLNAYPALFRQDLFGVGATLEKRWRYIVFSKFMDK